ncbi:MAG: hypothetical protein ACREBW_03845 [Candidatus Micrarchaeaceae archaeon]
MSRQNVVFGRDVSITRWDGLPANRPNLLLFVLFVEHEPVATGNVVYKRRPRAYGVTSSARDRTPDQLPRNSRREIAPLQFPSLAKLSLHIGPCKNNIRNLFPENPAKSQPEV